MYGKRLIKSGEIPVFDISTMTPVNSYSLTTGGDVNGMVWSDNGSHCYVAQYQGTTGVYQYTASTPWDVTTLSYSGNFSTFSDYNIHDGGLEINNDGTKFYVNRRRWNGSGFDCGVQVYTLTTPYNISTASSPSVFFNSGVNQTFGGQRWHLNGGFYSMEFSGNTFRGYSCPTPYSLSGSTLIYNFYDPQPKDSFDLTPDGRFFVWCENNNNNDLIYLRQFELDTPFDLSSKGSITTFEYNKSELPSPPGTVRQGQAVNFSTDGTKMYYLSGQGRQVVEFNTNVTF